MEIGNLIKHIYYANGHGIVMDKKQSGNMKTYYKIKWIGGGQSTHYQWFPEKELEVISRADG